MTCHDFQQELPEFLEQGGLELQAHLDQCAGCTAVVSDLRAITQQARTLRESDEPSPRVWNSIEIALRQEGLIRPQPVAAPAHSSFSFIRRWGRAAWLVPVAAMVLVGAFILGNPRRAGEPPLTSSSIQLDAEDQDALDAVSQNLPMMTASYRTNLSDVNQYILDAKKAVADDPNDEDARRSLMDAYEQKSMLYNIALQRSLQ